ncbi:hypothetical protein R3P38DRAFT_3378568 [Favolaschia claudopus]|uniref:Ubiquitin-like protease family profile domain-containing protein n=1 Tax=Favolaschia claudopus TaxID=2862362 RepID=A0AAV9Z883_9AGAR
MSGLPDKLKIPEGVERLALPAADIPVTSLINFVLPPQRKSTAFADPSDYLSDLPPTVTVFDVKDIPVPPSVAVKAFGRAILLDPDTQSIELIHSPAHRGKTDRYPLWLATIWSSMEDVRAARTIWRTAVDRVHEMLEKVSTSKAAAERANTALTALEGISWTEKIKGFKTGGSILDLSFWLTSDWLTTDHEDQMLELLALDLGLSDASTNSIQSTYFVQALGQAYKNPHTYRTARHFQWLRGIGTAFATKQRQRLGTIANVNGNHWVALTIDWEEKTIGYGDGFLAQVPKDLRKHLDWWIFEHVGEEFRWTNMPTPKQTDAHSCGILAYFALAHSFDKTRFPLPESSAPALADERIKMFLRIVEQHESKLGTFASEARDYIVWDHSPANDAYEPEENNDDSDLEPLHPASPVYEAPDNSTTRSDSDFEPSRSATPGSRASSPPPSPAQEEFPLELLPTTTGPDRPSTPPTTKRTYAERASDTPHTSPAKKKIKEKVESATRRAMDSLSKGTKIPALFRMAGWAKPKVLSEQEKQDVFAAEAEEGRMKAEEWAKRERAIKAERDASRKAAQNERQRRHRASKRAAKEAENPGARKRRKVALEYRETTSVSEVAEASRPARQIGKKIKEKNRKPQGRKQTKAARTPKYVNWVTPFSWSCITAAQRKVGWGLTDIVRELHRVNYDFFQYLTVQTLKGWIEKVDGFSRWTPNVLARAAKGNITGHNKGGRRGILSAYPEIIDEVISQLKDLRSAGAPLSLASVRCIIIATIRDQAPEIFEQKFKDGSTFQVSDSFCRKFLDKTLVWSMRKGTKAAQKLPVDAEEKYFPIKAWEMCLVRGGLNLSYSCMTSFETTERLANLRTERPDLWNDFNDKDKLPDYCPGDDEEVAEDIEAHEDEEMGADDSEVPTREVVNHVITKTTRKNRKVRKDGAVGLVSSCEAEDIDAEVAAPEASAGGDAEGEGSGKRRRRPNVRYAGPEFWRHANDNDEDLAAPADADLL